MKSVLQDWVQELPLMQQSVLISGIRGPDGIEKFHKLKPLIRFFRRSILISSFEGYPILHPYGEGGGSFTGPSITANMTDENGRLQTEEGFDWVSAMKPVVSDFMDSRDGMPFHYYTHMMHAFEIAGYKHSDPTHRKFWYDVYIRMVHALHLWPETEEQMDRRLGDNKEDWLARSDESATCSD